MTMNDPIQLRPINGAPFGARCGFASAHGAEATVLAAEENHEALLEAFYRAGGLLLLDGMEGIDKDPTLLLRIQPAVRTGRRGLPADAQSAARHSSRGAGDPADRRKIRRRGETAAAARPAVDGGGETPRPVPASPGLAHRPVLSPPAAGRLLVSGGRTVAQGPGTNAVCRRHGGL